MGDQKRDYVKGAPKTLIAFYEDALRNPVMYEKDGVDVELLGRLLTYPAMAEAWKELAKPQYAERWRPKDDRLAPASLPRPTNEWESIFEEMVSAIHDTLEQAIHHSPWRLRRSDVRDYFDNIAKSARAFASAVEKSPLDVDTHRFFPAPTLFALLCAFSRERWESGAEELGKAIRQDEMFKDEYIGKGVSFYKGDGRDRPFRCEGKRFPEESYIELEPVTEEGLRFWFKKTFEYGMPRMSVLASAVADAAEKEARHAEDDPSFILPKPRDARARRLYVIRYMAMWFKFWFGDYLRGTLARIVSTALDDDEIGPEHVDEATRNWTPPARPWTRFPYERPF